MGRRYSPLKLSSWREKLHKVIFGAETKAGKTFDVVLIASILISVVAVMLDSVQTIQARFGTVLYFLEWFFTLLFTVEYIIRIICVRRPIRYIISFFGLIDLLSILPTYLSLFLPGVQFLLVIRILRVLRIFRILKLVQYIGEANLLLHALKASSRKIIVFLFTVLTLIIIFGSLIYIIEGEENGFTSIPRSIYWAIVTMTTVGYGDISPKTNIGQTLAAVVMIIGYSIIAVPTGIISAEMAQQLQSQTCNRPCPACGSCGHDAKAGFCYLCGEKL
ncbi:MAG: ion transporter [Thermodesulfobacteriota bacterium]